MRRFLTVLTTLTLGAALALPTSGAQELSDGGRFGGGSSQLIPADSSLSVPLPETNTTVDLDRYQGKWYQVAAIPQPFTLQCASNTTAEYEVVNDSTISVRNSCSTLIGQDSVIEGSATTRSDASLRVNFAGVPFQDPNGPANYRVTYLDDDYELAVVGSPNYASGFVLSRTPDLNPAQWSGVRSIVESSGWWSCLFLTAPMDGGRGDIAPLCTQ